MSEIIIEVNPAAPLISVQAAASSSFAVTNISTSVSIVSALPVVTIENVQAPVIQVPVYNSYFSIEQTVIQISVNPQGAQGIKGDKGDEGSVYQFTAGMNISGGKVVYMSAGKIYTYTPLDELLYRAPIGFSKTAALINTTVSVQLFGLFNEAGLGLTPDADYFAADNGMLTANPSGLKVCQYMGRAISADEIRIEIQSPIITL